VPNQRLSKARFAHLMYKSNNGGSCCSIFSFLCNLLMTIVCPFYFGHCVTRTIRDKNRNLTTKFKLDYFSANLKLKINPKPSSLKIDVNITTPYNGRLPYKF
jgi:hypothetical protein